MVIYHLRPADMTAKDNTITGMYSEVTKLRKGTNNTETYQHVRTPGFLNTAV